LASISWEGIPPSSESLFLVAMFVSRVA